MGCSQFFLLKTKQTSVVWECLFQKNNRQSNKEKQIKRIIKNSFNMFFQGTKE
jgi:hypothetical protein